MADLHKKGNEVRILRINQVKERTGLSRTTLYTLIKQGQFAPPVPIGARCVGWLSSDVDAWIESRVKASRVTAWPVEGIRALIQQGS